MFIVPGKPSVRRGSAGAGALLLMKAIIANTPFSSRATASNFLKLPIVGKNLAVVDIAESWIACSPDNSDEAWQSNTRDTEASGTDGAPGTPPELQLVSFDFMFEPAQRAYYFRTINHLKMLKANSKANKAEELRRRVAPQTFEVGVVQSPHHVQTEH